MKKEEYKVVLPLDEFDAVCDEFLKAFDVVDTKRQGLIDAKGYRAYQRILMGNNVASLTARFGQRKRANVAGVKAGGAAKHEQALSEPSTADVRMVNVDQVSNVNHTDLSDPAFVLFSQKRKILLETDFSEIDTENEGVIEAVQLLEVMGLASAVGYMRSVFEPETKITDALWPEEACIVDEREAVDLAPLEDETAFEHDLYYALSCYLPDDADLLEDCQLETA